MDRRILLVEHDRRCALSLERTLAAAGERVVARATHAEDTLRKIAALSPEIVLIDVDVPGDGLALAASIRARTDIAVVMLAADEAAAERAQSERWCVGVDAGVAAIAVTIELAYRELDADRTRLPSRLHSPWIRS